MIGDVSKPLKSAQPDPVRSIDLIPNDWGPKFRSPVIDLTLTRRKADEIVLDADAHLFLLLLTPQLGRQIRLGSSRCREFDAPAGTAEIIPRGADFFGRWQVPKENILISLEEDRLNGLLAREFDVGTIEIRPIAPGTTDRTALTLARMIREEIRRESWSELFLESLTLSLAIHFVRTYSSLAENKGAVHERGGLTPKTRRDIESYIRANLERNLLLSDLASRSGLSYSHFLRAFRQTMGEPPHRYLMMLRARRAEQLILSSDQPLKNIALKSGFASQSHMTTVMKSLLHVRPGELRRFRAAPDPEVPASDEDPA